MTVLKNGATPCLECGTTGGYADAYRTAPERVRGYCIACYQRLKSHGRFTDLGQRSLMDHDAPCLGCQEHRRLMARQLCAGCYKRALLQGTVARYPACGPVPVPYAGPRYDEHPDMPPPLDAAAFGHFLWHDAEGNRAQAGVWGPKWHPSAEIARDETFAAAWMRAHPAQAILWDDPSLALFPASEARAA